MQLESSEGLDSTSTYPKWNLTFHFSRETNKPNFVVIHSNKRYNRLYIYSLRFPTAGV